METIMKPEKDILHRMRVKLYPNYLPKVKGKYLARTGNESYLTVEDICLTLTNRAGFTGKYQDLVGYVKQFLDEAVYQLCDGYGLNMGYYSISPNIGGTFDSDYEAIDPQKNKVNFKFRALKPLRNLAKNIEINIEGVAKVNACIRKFVDTVQKSTNDLFVPGNLFTITGKKIKVTCDNPDCGVFFVSADDPSKAVKVERIAENTSSKIIGVVPQTRFPRARIEIRTQFSGSSNTQLKNIRVIISEFVLEAA